jgi:hypothetical protein
MILALLGGAAGLLGGGGPLSSRRSLEEDGFRIEYDSAVHLRTEETLRLVLPARGPEARVAFATAYLESVSLERIVPAPASVVGGPEWTTFVLRVSEGSRPLPVRISVKPVKPGRIEGSVRFNDGRPLRFSQLVYP